MMNRWQRTIKRLVSVGMYIESKAIQECIIVVVCTMSKVLVLFCSIGIDSGVIFALLHDDICVVW